MNRLNFREPGRLSLPAVVGPGQTTQLFFLLLLFLSGAPSTKVAAQQQDALNPFGQGLQDKQANVAPGGNNGPGNLFGGNEGGGVNADFDSLIDLIQSTVAAESWQENGTGEGEITQFDINGVMVDARAALTLEASSSTQPPLGRMTEAPPALGSGNARSASALRFVSLPKLEAAIHARQMQHKPLDAEMLTLAGLRRVEYVLVLPETGDLVLAGPAGDWQVKGSQILSIETGEPVLRLDDLLVLWRRHLKHHARPFGCSINPRQAALAETQQYIQTTGARPLEPGQRDKWLEGLRDALGKQDVEFFGIEPASHAARVLLAADYHMKLIGMGLADSVDGVQSYLQSVRLSPDGTLPPMAVLRWWFAMQYDPVEVSAERTTFRLRGPGVQVLSENQLLAARGRRVRTGKSEDLNRQFATSFSSAIDRLSQTYPVYGELRNLFDLSLVLALIESEGLTERVGWHPTLFADANTLRLPRLAIATELDTVVNHRVIGGKHIIAGISGGVWVDAGRSLSTDAATGIAQQNLAEQHQHAVGTANGQQWWWD